MKKILSHLCVGIICVSNIYAMNGVESLNPQVDTPKTMRRINSEAKLLSFKENDKLPHMSRSDYLSMMEKFLRDNSHFLDYSGWILQLQLRIKLLDECLAKAIKRFPKIKEPDDNKIDISCPKIVESAMDRLTTVEAKKPISRDTALTMVNLKWILEHFDKYLKAIQEHGDMPVIRYSDNTEPYDSGLSDADIDLLIDLTVGEHRLFEISELTEIEEKKFIELGMKPMLRNATGFQRVISLIVVSVLNQIDKNNINPTNYIDHVNVYFLKGSKGSFHQAGDVRINESDDCTVDESLFHEITHAFHYMINLFLGTDELISNISIVNSNNINLIEQFFPPLRPSVMFSTVENIEAFIKKHWGADLGNIDSIGKARLIVLFLEPTLRNIMSSGFGGLIPYYKDWNTKDSLTVTEEALTSNNLAWCIYLSAILNENILDPIMSSDGRIIIPTNKSENITPRVHPVFNELTITPEIIKQEIPFDKIFGQDNLWNTGAEKLCMQGNILYQTEDGSSYYIQDRQNEQIYLVRSGKHETSIPILYRYRFHQKLGSYTILLNTFEQICRCISSPDKDWYREIKDTSEFSDLNGKICVNFSPSSEEKYSTNEKTSQSTYFEGIPIDEDVYEKFEKAINTDMLDQVHGAYQEDPSHMEDYDNFVLSKVQDLINKKVPVNVKNNWGETPLSLVSWLNFSKTKELLIKNGAINNLKNNAISEEKSIADGANNDIDAGIVLDEISFRTWEEAINSFKYDKILGGYYTNNLLARYKYYDNLAKQEVASLIEKGFSANVKDSWERTPLAEAIQQGFLETAQLLIDNGASVNVRNIHGCTIAHSLGLPCDYPLINEAIQLLLKNNVDINAKNRVGHSPLHRAIDSSYPRKDIIKALVENGADVDAIDYNGNTPMHTATGNSCMKTIDILKLLLTKGADINALNHRRETPSFNLLSHNLCDMDIMIDILEFMLAHGAKIATENNVGDTILHVAIDNWNCINGIDKFVTSLLKHGADINHMNYAGNTPLHLAVRSYYKLNAVKFLVANGARIDIKNYDGFTPLELAIKSYNNEVAEFLINKIDINSKYAEEIFRFAIESGNMDIINTLKSKGFDIKKQYDGFNTLELAIAHNLNPLAKLFLGDIEAKSKYGEKLFRLAAAKSNSELVTFFAEKGVNTNARDENGDTAMHFAVGRCTEIFQSLSERSKQFALDSTLKILKTIYQFGGDPNIANNQGIKPIQLSASKAAQDILSSLQKCLEGDKRVLEQIDQELKVKQLLLQEPSYMLQQFPDKAEQINQLIKEAPTRIQMLHKLRQEKINSMHTYLEMNIADKVAIIGMTSIVRLLLDQTIDYIEKHTTNIQTDIPNTDAADVKS